MVVKAHWSHLLSLDLEEDDEDGKGKQSHSKKVFDEMVVESYVLELVDQASKDYYCLNRHLDYDKIEKHVLTPSKYFRKFSHNHALY